MLSPVTARHGLPLLVPGQGQKDITLNEALALVDGLLGARVESRTLATPPAGPPPGAAWLVPGGATGDWVSQDGRLALMTDGGWRFLDLPQGARLDVADEGRQLTRTAGGWRAELRAPDAPAVLAPPSGGAVADTEARATLAALMVALRHAGVVG